MHVVDQLSLLPGELILAFLGRGSRIKLSFATGILGWGGNFSCMFFLRAGAVENSGKTVGVWSRKSKCVAICHFSGVRDGVSGFLFRKQTEKKIVLSLASSVIFYTLYIILD